MLLKAVFVKLIDAGEPGFIAVIDFVSAVDAAPDPPPPPPDDELLPDEEELLLDVDDTVTLLDFVVVTDEDVPEAVTVLAQSEEPWVMRQLRVASELCDREPTDMEEE